jgi:Sel1 repeat
MANQKSVSETRATGGVPLGRVPAQVGSDGPLVGTWSHAAPWDDSDTSRRRSIMASAGLGLLAIFAIAGGVARHFGAGSASCATGAECSQLGVQYAQGVDGVAADGPLAARLFQRACDLGHAGGCNNLGLAFQSGQGVPQDYERSMEYFGRACSAGFAEGCNNQGALYEHGQGVPVNLGDAQRLYTQACRHGSGLGCSNLGVLYAQGRGVPANPAEAARLFREACSAGSSVGCNNIVDSTPAPPEAIPAR